jgi:hypothetical protein
MDESHSELHPQHPEPPMMLSHVIHTLAAYRGVIAIALGAVAIAYLLIAVAFYLMAPSRQITSIPFRLTFEGALIGTYPNGYKFSTAEITSNEVLLAAYNRNQLGDFIDYPTFSRSVFVLEFNREYERLAAEYQAQLSDAKLTAVERDRIAREFELKRASLSKSDYSINYVASTRKFRTAPRSVIEKTLRDALNIWAGNAVTNKHVLEYGVPVLSRNVIDINLIRSEEPFVNLVLLRTRITELIEHVGLLRKLPGADLVRTKDRRATLAEVSADLQDIVRFRIDPFIATSAGNLIDRTSTLRVLEAQLVFDESQLNAAKAREDVLRNALAAYEKDRSQSLPSPSLSQSPATDRQGGETVMPQMNDTFLDRLIAITTDTADREFRQKLVNDIRTAALQVIPLQQAVTHDQYLVDVVRRQAGGAAPNREAIDAEWKSLTIAVERAVRETSEIYAAASRQLNPSTELFTVPAPSTRRIERSVSLRQLALGGVVTLLLSAAIIIALCLVHNRIREEDEMAGVRS